MLAPFFMQKIYNLQNIFIQYCMSKIYGKNIYIIGIGGISLSALAVMLLQKNYNIFGSDEKESMEIQNLQNLGAKIYIGHDENNITEDIDLVVFSAAINQNNPELIRARELGIKIITRSELLGLIASEYDCVISVAGTHGKTTTTGMLSSIFLNSGLNPTIHIGGNFKKIQGNVYAGGVSHFITEACEYVDSFLSLNNSYAVVLNIQKDHMDYFKTMNNLYNSFQKFINNTNKNGIVVINADEECEKRVVCRCGKVTFGIKNQADFMAKNITRLSNGKYSFDCFKGDYKLGTIELGVYGKHNIYNALASIVVAFYEGIDFNVISQSLLEFEGVNRRFQSVGKLNGASVIHDYAHHPSEIMASIKTAREIFSGKIFCIFQPHTFSRTEALWSEFCNSFREADEAIIYPIYPARENPIEGITSKRLSTCLQGTLGLYFDNYDSLYSYLENNVGRQDVVLILGAGDIVEFTKYFKNC